MKNATIITALIFVSFCANSQVYYGIVQYPTAITCHGVIPLELNDTPKKPQLNLNKMAAGCGLMFVSGLANGLHETLTNHYPAFQRNFPGANPEYWDRNISWKNKYKNGAPESGEKFIGSKTIFVWTTDAYHLTNTLKTGFGVAGTVVFTIGEKRPWWDYAVMFGAGALSFAAGNYITWDMIK